MAYPRSNFIDSTISKYQGDPNVGLAHLCGWKLHQVYTVSYPWGPIFSSTNSLYMLLYATSRWACSSPHRASGKLNIYESTGSIWFKFYMWIALAITPRWFLNLQNFSFFMQLFHFPSHGTLCKWKFQNPTPSTVIKFLQPNFCYRLLIVILIKCLPFSSSFWKLKFWVRWSY